MAGLCAACFGGGGGGGGDGYRGESGGSAYASGYAQKGAVPVLVEPADPLRDATRSDAPPASNPAMTDGRVLAEQALGQPHSYDAKRTRWDVSAPPITGGQSGATPWHAV